MIAAKNLNNGANITTVSIEDQTIDNQKIVTRGTNMSIKGIRVLPQHRISLSITYDYTLNSGSFNRTGQINPETFFITHFFPRITVYDDVDGWNEYAYLGKEEFYNDYGNFKVSTTVPGDFRVWATEDLKNATEVYEPEFVKRIIQAETHNEVIDIISPDDIKNGNITHKKLTNTWTFEATLVTDFAFAVSRNYIWKALSLVVDPASGMRTRVDAVYHPKHKAFSSAINYNRKTVDLISHRFPGIPFPYAHMSILDGFDAMEYPMMVNFLPFENASEMIEFTVHEVFHSIFPFYILRNMRCES